MKSKIEISCFECPNRNCSILKYCNSEWLSVIDNHKVVTAYQKGQQIIMENTAYNGIYFVLSGKVKLFKTGAGKREQIVRLLKCGDLFGYRGLVNGYFPVSATAVEDSWICFVEKENFQEVLLGNPDLTYNMMLFYATELNRSETDIRKLAQFSVRQKVADALVKIHDCFNGSANVYLSRQNIADLAGTTREQVSKNLSHFREEKIIALNGKRIQVVDLDRLQVIAKASSI